MFRFIGMALVLAFSLSSHVAHAAAAIAGMRANNGYHYMWCTNKKTEAEARSCSLKECRDAARDDNLPPSGCEVFMSDAHRPYWAIYNATDGSVWYATASDRQSAINGAYQSCVKGAGEAACPNEAANVFTDGVKERAPRTWHTHCETHNSDANCVRTYSDGEVLRFKACVNPRDGSAFDRPDGSCSGFDMHGEAYSLQWDN